MNNKLNAIRFTEKMVNEGLRKALRERDASDSIEVFIQHLGEESGSDRIYIFEGSKEFTVCNTFEWCADGVSSEKDNLQHMPLSLMEEWINRFEATGEFYVEDIGEAFEPGSAGYNMLQEQGIRSLQAVPLYRNDKRTAQEIQ